MIGAVSPLWYGFFQTLFFGKPFGSPPMSLPLLFLFWLLFGLGLPLLIYKARLTVTVRANRLDIQYFPFHLKARQILPQTIQSVQARSYRPILEYGGWGLRWSFSGRGQAYNVSGKQGVQLKFKDETQLLLGSQKAPALEEAIQSLIRSQSTT
jgi:hypothetical protein